MNTAATSKEDILKVSRELIRQKSHSAVNIRSVAAACGISVGCVYNYFDSKAELMEAVIESVWCEIFDCQKEEAAFGDTEACISWIYRRMEYGSRQYPGFFTLHSLGFMQKDKLEGKQRMWQTWQHILDMLCFVLKSDAQIRPNAFTEKFTVEKFAGVLFSLMLSALLCEDYDPDAVLEIVRRTLY